MIALNKFGIISTIEPLKPLPQGMLKERGRFFMIFNKPPLTIQDQIEHLQNSYKIKCKDKDLLAHYLKHCNYYRLRGYWLFFEDIGKINNIYFEEVINIFEFDSEIRVFFLEYIEKIESSIKSIFANYLTIKYNKPHIHLDKSIFENEKYHKEGIENLKESFKKSQEIFAKHFRDNYEEELPPLWVSVELMTFGEISKWYRNLNKQDRKKIAKEYGLRERFLWSFLSHLTEIRNIVAHHARLWNKVFSKGFQVPPNMPYDSPAKFKLYHTILMMDFLLHTVLKNNDFLERLSKIIMQYNIPIKYMGFPANHNIESLKNARYEY